jgi:hypothetical protein
MPKPAREYEKIKGYKMEGGRFYYPILPHKYRYLTKGNGGETGIRTPEGLSPQHAFQACALNRSATSPARFGGLVRVL